MDEIELEVFRADTRASRGITSADIAEAASIYDPANAPAGICLGHPKSDTPAFGRVKSFRADGASLFATIPVQPELIDGVKKETLLNRSLAFFSRNHEANPRPGKLYPRHLGFLGASAPGIPGMKPLIKALAFTAEDDGGIEVIGEPAEAVIFEPAPTPVFIARESTVEPKPAAEPTADQLKADREQLEKDRLAFEAEQSKAHETANAGIVDGLVAGGKLLPKDRDNVLLVFNALDPAPLEFTATDGKAKDTLSPAAALGRLLGTGVKLVPVDEGRTSPSAEFKAGGEKDDPKAIEREARKLMTADSTLSFEAAVEQVTGQQEA